MKYKLTILLFLLVSTTAFGQFFETEEDYDLQESEAIMNNAIKFLSDSTSLTLVDSILAHAKSFMGVPYRYGGSTPAAFDCSGFIMYIHNDFGFKLPRTATAQYLANTHVDKKDLRKGDLVFFEGRKRAGKIGHVGMMVSDSLENGNFNFIHASVNRGVIITYSGKEYYTRRYFSACRVVDADSIRTPKKNIVLKSAANLQTEQSTENKYHTVKKGESLHSIAKKYGKTVVQIKKLNGLSNNNLKTGKKLLINKGVKKVEQTSPRHSALDAESPETKEIAGQARNDGNESVVEYFVKAGDTLYGIAKKFNTTVEKIKKDNNLINNNLKINQKLIIRK